MWGLLSANLADNKKPILCYFTQRKGSQYPWLLHLCWQLAALCLAAEGPIALCPTLSSGLPLRTAYLLYPRRVCHAILIVSRSRQQISFFEQKVVTFNPFIKISLFQIVAVLYLVAILNQSQPLIV